MKAKKSTAKHASRTSLVKSKTKRLFQELKNPASTLQTVLLTAVPAIFYLVRAFPYFEKPQLFAEDGVLWLSYAHNLGFSFLYSKPVVYNGFFHTPEHIFGYVVSKLPLLWAPSIFAYSSWALFILMTYYLLSRRTRILTNNFERIGLVLCLGLIANFTELFFEFSNSVFLMGIIGALILIAEGSKNRVVNIAEKIFFFLACMCVPFAWAYLPIILYERLRYKTKNNYFLIVSIATSIAQFIGYHATHTYRSPVTLVSMASKWMMLVIYNQIVIPALRFARIDIDLSSYGQGHYHAWVVALTLLTMLAATLYVFKQAKKEVRYLLFFLLIMEFGSLKSPTIRVDNAVDVFKNMANMFGGNRYFIYGIVALNIITIKLMYEALNAKVRYAVLSVFIAFGVISSIHYSSFHVNKGWNDYTAQYQKEIKLFNSGAKSVAIPVNPAGWVMILVQK